jgi:hypothetical protein
MKLLREYIRNLILEQAETRTLYRGLNLSFHPDIADEIRLSVWEEDTPRGEDELISLFKESLDTRSIGGSWSMNERVARTFAGLGTTRVDVEGSPELHVILVAEVPRNVGYDPTMSGEEFIMFSDESEQRIPKGTEIKLSRILIYSPSPKDKYGGVWYDLPGAWKIGKVTV